MRNIPLLLTDKLVLVVGHCHGGNLGQALHRHVAEQWHTQELTKDQQIIIGAYTEVDCW